MPRPGNLSGFVRSLARRRRSCPARVRFGRSRRACIRKAAYRAWLFAARQGPAVRGSSNSRRSRGRGRRAGPRRWKYFCSRRRRAFRRRRAYRDGDRAQAGRVLFARRHLRELRSQAQERWCPACSRWRRRGISDGLVFSFSFWSGRKDRRRRATRGREQKKPRTRMVMCGRIL